MAVIGGDPGSVPILSLSPPVLTRSDPQTFPTGTHTPVYLGVLRRVLVAVRTMCLESIASSRRVSSKHILSGCHRLQMLRIDAATMRASVAPTASGVRVTQMIDRQALRDRTNEVFVGPAVGSHRLLVGEGESAVAVIAEPGPEPTSGFDDMDLFHESLDERNLLFLQVCQRVAVVTPPRVMDLAPSTTVVGTFATLNRASSHTYESSRVRLT